MLTIDDIRSQYPDTKDLSDAEVLSRVARLTKLPLESVAQDFGIADPRKAPKGAIGGVNDFMINTANAAVGGIKSAIDFVSPGSSVSGSLDEFIKSGEQKLSLQERLSQERLSEGLSGSDIGTQAGAVWQRAKEAPFQLAGQAIGSFAIPGTAIKGARGVANALGAGEKALAGVGTGAAMLTGAALSGGDAAGEAYDRVFQATGDRDAATDAARKASVAPALVGGLSSLFGADRALARGGSRSILRTTAGEFGGEFFEEGTTKLSANLATSQYVPNTDVMAGVFGSGLLGGIQGAGTGLAVGIATKQRSILGDANQPTGDAGIKTDGSGIGKAININEAQVNTKSAIPPNGVINVTAGGEALVTPEQQKAYDQYGRNQTGPFQPPPAANTPNAPNAQAQSGQAAAANAQNNQQQQQQVTQQKFTELASVYGVVGGQPGKAFNLAGKNLFTQQDAETFLRQIDKLNEGKSLEQKKAMGAVLAANAIKVKPNATAQQVVGAVNKFLDGWSLSSSTSADDFIARLEANIQSVEGSKALDQAGSLNDIYRHITGQDSPIFVALQKAADVANQPKEKVKKAAPALPAAQQPSAPTSVDATAIAEAQARIDAENAAQTTTGAVNEQPLSEQNNAGLREVPVQGATAGSSQGGNGLVQPQRVQPVGAGSVAGGQNSLEDDTGGTGGTRSSANELPTANVPDDELNQAEAQIRELVVASFGERDADIIYDVLMNDLSGPKIAKKYGISQQRVDQIAGPKAQTRWGKRFEMGAEKLGMTIDQVEALFEPFKNNTDKDTDAAAVNANAIAEAQARLDAELADKENQPTTTEDVAQPEEEAQPVDVESTTRRLSDEFDKDAPGGRGFGDDLSGNDGESTPKNAGVRIFEIGKSGEVGVEDASSSNRSYAKFKKSGAAKLEEYEINNILAEVEDLTDDEVTELIDRARQLETLRLAEAEEKRNKGKKSAVQKSSTEEVPVRQRAGRGKAVAEGNAEGSKAAPEGKAETKTEITREEQLDIDLDANRGNPEAQAKTLSTYMAGGSHVRNTLQEIIRIYLTGGLAKGRERFNNELRGTDTDFSLDRLGLSEEESQQYFNEADEFITGKVEPYIKETPKTEKEQLQALLRYDENRLKTLPKTRANNDERFTLEMSVRDLKQKLEVIKQAEEAKTPEQQWTEAVAPFDGAPWDSLSKDQQDRVTDLVQRGQFNLAAANKIASEKPVETTTAAQKEKAEMVAAKFGGVVAWQEGDIALIRGYSVLSGQPTYIPALGSRSARVDISAFTGDIFTAEQKAKLEAEKKRLESEAEAKHKSDPFITFSGDGVAVSKSVSPELVGVITGWKKLLGLTSNIYVTTIEDARADKNNFTGPHRAVGSAALDAQEKGSMRKLPDGSYYIAFTKSTSKTLMLEVLAHEMGHVHEREAFKNAPKETQNAIIAEHKKWLDSQKGKTGTQLVEALRARAAGRATRSGATAKAEDMSAYWKSFSEWYADQVSRWAVTSEKPMSVVEKFFSRLAAAMKKFYYSLKGQKYLPSETMKQFLDKSAENLTTQEMAGDTNNFESSSMFAGQKALKRVGNPDSMADLVAARLMESQGESAENIWKDTGWYRNVDGAWRFEISDDAVEMADSTKWAKKEKLGHIIDHPELFESYPELKNTVVNVVKNPLVKTSGAYDVDNKSITITLGSSSDEDIKQVLLHEVQHAIQAIEGFATGANPADLKLDNNAELQKVKTVLEKQIALEEFLSVADEAQSKSAIRVINKLLDGSMTPDQADKSFPQSTSLIRNLMYLLTSGEVEARNVENRIDMDVFERQQNPPSSTQKIADSLQIIREGEKVSASIAATRQLAEEKISKLPKPYQGPLNTIADTLANIARKGITGLAFTKDLAAMAAQRGLKSALNYVNLMGQRQAIKTENERRVEKIVQEFDKLDSKLKGTGPGSVNAFLKESTLSGKWGFDPSWISGVKVDEDLAEKFDALPKQAQNVVKSVFRHGFDTLAAMKKGVMDNINSEYDALIADAQARGDAKDAAELQKKKIESLQNYQSLMSVNAKSPYTPLKRFGNYVVVGRSADYLDAETAAENTSSTPEERAEARKQLRKYETDEKHYFVQFAETDAEAKAIARDTQRTYPGGLVQNFQKDQVRDSLYGGRDIQGVFYRLRNLINDSQEEKGIAEASKKSLNRLVNDLHLSLLSEHSARQSERQRKGIAGADEDMMRAFVTQGRATAHFISTLHNTGQIYDSLRDMKKEANARTEGRDVRSQYYNELMKRHAMTLDYQVSPVIDKAMSVTSTWMLLTSPAYYLQNMTQPFMMSLPVLAGKHGYAKSASAMTRAYRELTSVLSKNGLNEETYGKMPSDVRAAIESLVNSGHIDISLSQDLGRWRSSGDQNIAAKALDKIKSISEDVEAINRVVTAVAAYRLEKDTGTSQDKAVEYAGKVVYDTHGDYSGFNAPRVSRQGFGRLATQFRKFQLIQISLIAKLSSQAFGSASAAERAIGKKALAYTLTHTFAVGGVMGLPGFAAIAWILGKAFGDDDEPDNPEATLRKMIGDDAMADLLLKGVPKLAGVDLSGKLGMGQMLSLLPYTDIELSRDGYAKVVTAAMGPFIGGIMPKVVDGVAQMANGEYYKGIETMAPTGLGQAMKGYRAGTEGLTKRNGEVILSPDEITFFDAFMQGIGLPTNTITDRQFINRSEIKYEQFYNDRTSDIKRDYISAYKSGDSEAMEEARQDWRDMQDSRRKNGFKIQPMSDLFKAPQAAMKREVKTNRTLNTSGATSAGFQLR